MKQTWKMRPWSCVSIVWIRYLKKQWRHKGLCVFSFALFAADGRRNLFLVQLWITTDSSWNPATLLSFFPSAIKTKPGSIFVEFQRDCERTDVLKPSYKFWTSSLARPVVLKPLSLALCLPECTSAAAAGSSNAPALISRPCGGGGQLDRRYLTNAANTGLRVSGAGLIITKHGSVVLNCLFRAHGVWQL